MTDVKWRPKRFKFSSKGSGSSSASSSVTSSSSSDEETDAKDLKPIKEYISNRKEIASQLFKSVKAEKIRLMLPQILKKVEFSDLEELCANELIGMSKARILSIVNGQEMLQSSETEDSDDSGPSLEIVSDTEWLSAEENIRIKVEGKKKTEEKKNKKVQNQNKQDTKSKLKSKEKGKGVKVKLEKVKTEGKDKAKDKEKEKEKVKDKAKEGESLLDLLELEMRARAIRALIRKEEDASKVVQSNGANTTEGSDNSNEQNTKTRHANLKKQLEKIDVLMKHGEDEDVYVVINPAPTIELLSSDSDNDNSSKRINQKFANERTSEAENVQNKDQPSTSNDKDISANKEKDVNQDNAIVNNGVNKEKENDKAENLKGKDKVEKSKEKDKTENPKERDKAEKSKEKDKTQNPKERDRDKAEKSKEKDKTENPKVRERDKADKSKEKDKTENPKERDKAEKSKERETKNDNLPMSVIENNSNDKMEDESKKESDLEEGEILDDEDDGAGNISIEDKITEQSSSKNIKRVKKNPHIRSKKKNRDTDEESGELNTSKPNKKEAFIAETKASKSKNGKLHIVQSEPIEIEESPERPKETDKIIDVTNDKEESSSKIDLFDDRALDIEEIINLDDYPDDMDDLEKSKSNVEGKKSEETNKNSGSEETQKQKSETWATRYYQQDDVQSVIKESKIQSEIRKRLRERQRQNKLNNSPNLNQEPLQTSTQEIVIPKPTGSVEEYLALKGQLFSNSQERTNVVASLAVVNSAMENSNDSSQTESTTENTNSPIQSDKIVNQSIVIVKKAKLNENLSVVKKIDIPTLDVVANIDLVNEPEVQIEPIEIEESPEKSEETEKMYVSKDDEEESGSKKHENLIKSSEEIHVKQKNSPLSVTDEGSKKENPKADYSAVNEETSEKEETSAVSLKKDSTAEAGPMSSGSDSSEDNVVVKIGDSLTSPNERTEQATSELRPD